MIAGFAVQQTLTIITQNGNCDIELCFGDITKLQLQDKVDVIMVSAFRGDYTPTPSSVLGALKRNLKLDVEQLARNKAEDLRNIHSCWWSHELPAKFPYKRLLCFETKHHGKTKPQELVGDVYRCLVPILNNEDGTVITPLLNTGNQGYSKVRMLKRMVEAAVNWMKAGLPLRKLKIVLYSRFEAGDPPPMKGFGEVCETFSKLKKKFDMKSVIQKEVKIEYDVYLSFSKEDGDTVSSISKNLEVAKPNIRIFGNQQELNKDQVWQEDMYEVMIRCARVITVLSPNYLNSTTCVEQYNIALCCNRKARRDLLAPFYIKPIEKMPTYMGLVQYINCLTVQISFACEQLALTLNVDVHAEFVHEQPTLQYDVFISYCHRNSQEASELRETITNLDPKLKVFFDTQELKTGTTWQQTLYHAIDGTKILVAMVTKEYLLSPVCREEFNLALAKHSQKDRELTLVPILLDEDIKDIPIEFQQIKLVDATGESFNMAIKSTAEAIVAYMNNQGTTDMKELFAESTDHLNVHAIQENLRASELKVNYPDKTRKSNENFPPDLDSYFLTDECETGNDTCDVVLSFAGSDKKYAKFFYKLLKHFAPSLSVVDETKSAQHMRDSLDKAAKIVTFVSPSYVESHDCAEDFNIALCRHRTQNNPVIFPIQVHILPKKPTYFHTVQYVVATTDTVWTSLIMRKVTIKNSINNLNGGLSEPEVLALLIAAGKLVNSFRNKGICTPPPRPVLSNIGRLISVTKELNKDQVDAKTLTEMLIKLKIAEKEVEQDKNTEKDNEAMVKDKKDDNMVDGKEVDKTDTDNNNDKIEEHKEDDKTVTDKKENEMVDSKKDEKMVDSKEDEKMVDSIKAADTMVDSKDDKTVIDKKEETTVTNEKDNGDDVAKNNPDFATTAVESNQNNSSSVIKTNSRACNLI